MFYWKIYISNFTKIIRNNMSNKYFVKKSVSYIIFIMNLKYKYYKSTYNKYVGTKKSSDPTGIWEIFLSITYCHNLCDLICKWHFQPIWVLIFMNIEINQSDSHSDLANLPTIIYNINIWFEIIQLKWFIIYI